ncbi:hypothetical protein BpOF4_09930 [Alkalihalophilus pseudofirmus OF4]|uniref:Helicase HerA central domain-containing protein n=1 Tax=Alkalihalophilus pseudofirmus (strain ATCC BAA-2126 / JCM 17055 / OF4) TaxID=398511 RepID=D3FTG8_ALKPO|nr:anti-phage-associated helicase HerA [Alkalihalophilus pseudofirmus]ADC50041.1 hypothetical protein BpOF4_09930 [Alkalihalophilus pseudofirmus OF4]
MINIDEEKIAKVVSVLPNKIKIEVTNIELFKVENEKFAVGSYLRVSDSDDCALISVIENFTIEKKDNQESHYVLEAVPLGFLDADGKFSRGGNNIAIPPTDVELARNDEIQNIYDVLDEESKFCFSKLSQDTNISVPVNGDKFFNKHIAVVGSTGSGKSHTVTKVLQEAINQKVSSYPGLNNSHIVLFDIHSEYKSAFPDCNYIDVESLLLPYWLMNGEELEELFVESGENQSYNQSSILRRVITRNKQKHNNYDEDITFDTPVKFSIAEVLNCITNLSKETRKAKQPTVICIEELGDEGKEFEDDDKFDFYFNKELQFKEIKPQSVNKGTYNDGTLEKFISRIRNKISDKRLGFLFSEEAKESSFEDILRQLIGYKNDAEANITISDLSGVPFEVLSTTVSLISRLLFEYGYFYKKHISEDSKEITNTPCPLLLVYEEAHKYVPKIKSAKYNASRTSIERIAKEGRKYGVTAMIVSQRPSEISETIFSQCSNFISMRLTNPEDQNYVKRLLPDVVGPITDSLSTLKEGEAILIGDSIIMPSLVKIDRCHPQPSSNDIPYLKEWKKEWVNTNFEEIINKWVN